MPRIFKIGPYLVYFWSNEGDPLEPIHVHITEGDPSGQDTKVWITQSGNCLLCNNASRIHKRKLEKIMSILESRSDEIVKKWISYFGKIYFYC